jgi:phytanoyl-CoA hydroxylase
MHLVAPEFMRLFTENTLSLELQDYLNRGETVLYTSLFFQQGSEQNIHVDAPLFCTRPENKYFGMWVSLDDVDESNGPLIVVEGGHRGAEIDRASIARACRKELASVAALDNDLWDAYQAAIYRECTRAGLKVREVHVKMGPRGPTGRPRVGTSSRIDPSSTSVTSTRYPGSNFGCRDSRASSSCAPC